MPIRWEDGPDGSALTTESSCENTAASGASCQGTEDSHLATRIIMKGKMRAAITNVDHDMEVCRVQAQSVVESLYSLL